MAEKYLDQWQKVNGWMRAWVDAFPDLRNVRNRLKVVDELLRIVASGASVHYPTAPFQKHEFIKGLQTRAS